MPVRPTTWLLAAALFLAPAAAWADAEHPEHVPAAEAGTDLQEYVAGATRLEGRIMAPCCWNQTIDIHGSEPAYELRREIRRRLKAGEASDAIEASLVQRFGSKILAVPDSSPLGGMATLLFVGFGVAGYAAFAMLRRWTRAGAAKAKKAKPDKAGEAGVEPGRDALDERLDRELADFEHQA